MGRKAVLAACTLNQWALDFEGNFQRILKSIGIAKELGASFRSGPELEICGYSCEDHFFEEDTRLHSWEVIIKLLNDPLCQDILIDVGMPVLHNNILYNCRVIFYSRNILLIRPKLLLCDVGNYRESRWFSPWRKVGTVEDFYLPELVVYSTGQEIVPFGDAVIATGDASIGFEICEELWSPNSTHIPLSIDGVEIIVNSSGSHTALRKAHVLVGLIKNATFKCGGCYMFSNLRGCDGQRLYFNGNSCITLNGDVLCYDTQFSLKDVSVICAIVDIEDIRSYRNSIRTRGTLSDTTIRYQRIRVPNNFELSTSTNMKISLPCVWTGLTPEMEIAQGPACWLWDYLRRSNQAGFFLPLSGGVDSASTACIVYSMCRLAYQSVQSNDENVLNDMRKIVGDVNYIPRDAKDLCGKIFHTMYMGTENSSAETRDRAKKLALQIGSYHQGICIDAAVRAVLSIFTMATGKTPNYIENGGSQTESLALQNIQARLRMVLSYLFAQLTSWVRGRSGALLVLGSGNVDEALRGYFTKYDCSSADLNPIGSISKSDLKLFLAYARKEFDLPIIEDIISAVPTAELTPLKDGNFVQTDEEEMGMTYDELSVYGKLRKISFCGPYSMYCKLVDLWKNKFSPLIIADKVKHFFRMYAINRHKMTTITPSYHAENYSPDDNRFDHRQFLYPSSWKWQFSAIDKIANEKFEELQTDTDM